MFKKENKKKVSIDFYETVLDKLIKYRNKTAAPSNSAAVNYVLDATLNLSDDVKETLAQCCAAQIHSLYQDLKTSGEFGRHKAEYSKNEYKKLIDFFTDGKGIVPKQTAYMKKVNIIDGYVIFPDDWIITKYQNPENCKYVGVVETKNGAKYNTPHFIVFSTKPIHEMTDSECDEIFHYCCIEHPQFKQIIEKNIPLQYDRFHNVLNSKEWEKAPHPAIFAINDYGQPESAYPFGAMIVRNQK